MLIINADDFGRSLAETDAALTCYKAGRITSVTAMVFMADSERAAQLVKDTELDVGLHLNFSERFTERNTSARLSEYQNSLVNYLRRNKYSQLFYNPFVRKAFSYSYQAQAEEFERLFAKSPSHIDGHHHMHLCANILFSHLIPSGMKVRRSFSFWPGEKSWFNRMYRGLVDRLLTRRYQLSDYFFDLTQSIQGKKMDRVQALAKLGIVELMTHPVLRTESEYLMSDDFSELLQCLEVGTYALA